MHNKYSLLLVWFCFEHIIDVYGPELLHCTQQLYKILGDSYSVIKHSEEVNPCKTHYP